MRKDYLDLKLSDAERKRRVRRFWLKEWCWIMVGVVLALGVFNALVWLIGCNVPFMARVIMSATSVLVGVFSGWEASETWRKPKVPTSFLDQVRGRGGV